MDEIYQKAVVCIVAASGDHVDSGIAGISTGLRTLGQEPVSFGASIIGLTAPALTEALAYTSWNTRGWTFQELMLSKRCLIFTPVKYSFNAPNQRVVSLRQKASDPSIISGRPRDSLFNCCRG